MYTLIEERKGQKDNGGGYKRGCISTFFGLGKEGRENGWMEKREERREKGREGRRKKEELENYLKGGGKTLLESRLT